MHSPYLTNPLNKYPKEVFTMSSKLKELKSAGDFIYDVNYIVVFDRWNDEDDDDDDDDISVLSLHLGDDTMWEYHCLLHYCL